MNKKYFFVETAGVAFAVSGYLFMKKLYELSGFGLVGVLFGSVNDSPWENAKALLLPYLVWGLIELMCLGRLLKQLTGAKVCGAAALLAVYLPLSLRFPHGIALAALSAAAGTAVSFFVFAKTSGEPFFAPALCALFLLTAFYFSFTPFPPHNALFLDAETGVYGMIPPGYDYGANALDALFYVNQTQIYG